MSRAVVKPAGKIGLQVLHGDERRGLPRHSRPRRIEHVGMGVDQAGQHRRLAEIDHLGAGGHLDLGFRPDLGDALAVEDDDLLRPHLAGLAVEQLAGADRRDLRRRRALVGGAVAAAARRRAGAPPWSGRRPFLGIERGRQRGGAEKPQRRRSQSGYVSHRVILSQVLSTRIAVSPGMPGFIHRPALAVARFRTGVFVYNAGRRKPTH